MNVRNNHFKATLWCLLCVLPITSTQELDHFKKDTTIEFAKDKVLADMGSLPKLPQSVDDYDMLTKLTSFSTISDSLHTNGNSDAKVASENTAPSRSKSTPKLMEDSVRLGRVLSSDELTTTMSTPSEEDTTMSNRVKEASKIGPGKTNGLRDLNGVQGTYTLTTPPNIRYPNIQERLIVPENKGVNYTVKCEAVGIPEPIYKWMKDGELLSNSGDQIRAFQDGTLMFKEFSDRENGLYQCSAENQHGTSLSIKLPIVYEKSPGLYTGNQSLVKTYDGQEGEPMSFECIDTPPTIPDYPKRWNFIKDSKQLNTTDRIGTDSKGVLRFAYLEPSDDNEYICALAPKTATTGDQIRSYNTAILKVRQTQQKVKAAPRIAYVSTNVKATVGKTATLECFLSGYPIPNITWTARNNHVVNPDDKKFVISDFGRKLIIQNVVGEDAGKYICTGSNGYGSVIKEINVNVTAPPMKVPYQILSTHIVPDNRDFELNCTASIIKGQSMETPIWYRNGAIITESNLPYPGRYSFSADMTKLHIENLNKEQDTACFQCNISNSEGYLFQDGYLRVINSLTITKSPEKDFIITKDDVIDISVLAKGDDCCQIIMEWHLNGSLLSKERLGRPPYQWINDGNTLLFNASSVTNEKDFFSSLGTYSCRVSNSHQWEIVTFVIALTDTRPPESQIAVEAGFQLWWIGLICGILLIIIAIIIIIVVIKSNYPRDTYPLEKAEIKHHLDPEKDLLDQSFQEI